MAKRLTGYDWTRKLAEPIDAGDKKLRTLGDLRAHILALPRERQDYRTWTHAGTTVYRAASGDVDTESAAVAFRIARMMDP